MSRSSNPSTRPNRFLVTLLLAAAWGGGGQLPTVMAIDPPGVGANVRVNDPLGRDGLDFPGTLIQCLEDPICDDDPKAQNEPAITVAPWDPNILIASFNDHSKKYLGPPPSQDELGFRVIAFAISDDGGNTWKRFDHTLNPCNMTCNPSVNCFVPGNSLAVDDIGIDLTNPANPCFQWGGVQSDPATAAGGTPLGDKYLYIVGIDGSPTREFFTRLRWEDPMTGWEAAVVPPGTGGDKPYLTADPFSEDVYVYWGGSVISLTASRCAGCDFLNPNPLPPVVARRLSFCSTSHPGTCPGAGPSQGAVASVGPEGEFNIVWLQPNGAIPFLGADFVAQIRYRRGEWNAGGDLDFVPPLPSGLGACPPTDFCCTEGVDCATPIVIGQPGFDVGFRPLFPSVNVSLVHDSLNEMKINSFPSIAVDRNDPGDLCGRGGTVYVVYAAEELPGDCPTCTDFDADCADPEILDRIIDSNIYLVRGRVSTLDGSIAWSAPVLIEANPQLPPPLALCNDPLDPVPCGIHVPFQFFPWVAVDDDGRVGVMFYDTTPDQNRCDKNIVYRIRFAYSLDGGVTWEFPVSVSDANSQTAPPDPLHPDPSTVFIGDYSGMTAGTDAGVRGIFHPIWTDLREWAGDALDFASLTAGDIYKGTVTIGEPVYSMGDYDRDGDVDTDDFNAIRTCANAGQPMPPLCEILDFNRDNVIDKKDEGLFGQCRTGHAAGSSGGGDPTAFEGMVTWTTEVMSPQERTELANAMRQAAPSFGAT